jgi:hypothetical protein
MKDPLSLTAPSTMPLDTAGVRIAQIEESFNWQCAQPKDTVILAL